MSQQKNDAPRWISVKDKLPEFYELVLTYDGNTYVVEQRIPYITGENEERIELVWWVNCSGLRDGATVAWMPLPEPPEEGMK